MPQPVLSSFAQDLYDALAPLTWADGENQWALANYLAGIGKMFQIVEDYGRDTSAGPGWSSVVDLDRAPTAALPWLAQFLGVEFDAKLTDAQQRAKIIATDGWNRGTVAAFIAAAQRYLTGTKQVIMRERDGDAWTLTVVTKLSETPDQTAVLNAMLAQKPAGINLIYNALDGYDYQQVYTNYATYQTVFTTFTTYEGLLENNPGH